MVRAEPKQTSYFDRKPDTIHGTPIMVAAMRTMSVVGESAEGRDGAFSDDCGLIT
jgi:hypothetical protein